MSPIDWLDEDEEENSLEVGGVYRMTATDNVFAGFMLIFALVMIGAIAIGAVSMMNFRVLGLEVDD